jgi:hypothetical protein
MPVRRARYDHHCVAIADFSILGRLLRGGGHVPRGPETASVFAGATCTAYSMEAT